MNTKVILLTSMMLAQIIGGSFKEGDSTLNLKTNENYIKNLNNEINLSNSIELFEYVFNSLSDEVIVFPTENYYYYQLEISGKTIKGNLALFAEERDEGNLNFAFEEVTNSNIEYSDDSEGILILNKGNGVDVVKVNEFEYNVTFKSKTVKFHLNKIDIHTPIKLHPNESYVGPSVDESGLTFHLIFNNKLKNFFWILNNDSKSPETFAKLNENVWIGKRTEFVFFDEEEMSRKILFAVKKENIEANNWFDGPFDQLPDNYIKTGEIQLQKYLEEAYPFYKGKINKYGHFLEDTDSRVAISPYTVYNSFSEVLKVYYACKNSSNSNEEFIFNLAKERYFESEDN